MGPPVLATVAFRVPEAVSAGMASVAVSTTSTMYVPVLSVVLSAMDTGTYRDVPKVTFTGTLLTCRILGVKML